MTYDPLTYETDWSIGTAEKGTRYAIRRTKSGGEIALLPYGLRPEEKALACMIAATPALVHALRGMLDMPEWDGTAETSRKRLAAKKVAREALQSATYTQPETV